MELSLRRWKPGQLLLGWGAYWVGLIGISLGPAIRATWRATHLPHGHGSVNAGFNNGMLNYEVIEEGVKTWAGATPFSTALLWLVGPPLLLWLVWLIVRERPSARQAALAGGGADALPAGEGPATNWRVTRDDRVGADGGRVRTPNP
jgi:hypothetical protein